MLNNLFKRQTPKGLLNAHVHDWALVSKTYAPPFRGLTVEMLQDADLAQKVLFGVTTLLWKCNTCSETRKDEMIGSDADTIEEMLDRVDASGPQRIERGADTYILGKAPDEPEELIPVR